MNKKRIERVNSLLKEVLSEVISRDVNNPKIAPFLTITNVDISKDLHHAKVLVSVLGSAKEKEETIQALESAAGFIAITASKKIVLRHFPTLTFKLDSSVDQFLRIDALLGKIHDEQKSRNPTSLPNNEDA